MYNQDGVYETDIKKQYCGIISNRKIFIPPKESRGFIARSILYYKYQYRGNIKRIINEDTLYDWGMKYEVTKEEYQRNIDIYKFQENINPFIDNHLMIYKYS